MNAIGRKKFCGMWWSSVLWAIPISYVLCVLGVGLALTVGLATDDFEHSASEYVGAALAAPLIWGTVVFIGTCYVVIPLVTTLIAAIRYFRYSRTRNSAL